MNKIQVGFLVSYDYELLKNSLPRVYKEADTIFLAIDIERKTWNGSDIQIDNSFFEWIYKFDVDNKIILYENNFYIDGLSTMEAETRQRKLLAEQMGIGNWLIQIDSDEYFIDFKSFVDTLKNYNHYLINPHKKQIQFSTFLINIYKKVDDGFLYIDQPTKCISATNYPSYIVARNTRKRIIYTKFLCFHETLSREEKDLEFKFNNWGHNKDVNPFFLEKWKSATKYNYKSLKNLFYLEPHKWKKLNYVKGNSIEKMIENFSDNDFAPSDFFLLKKNFGQWFKFLFKK